MIFQALARPQFPNNFSKQDFFTNLLSHIKILCSFPHTKDAHSNRHKN